LNIHKLVLPYDFYKVSDLGIAKLPAYSLELFGQRLCFDGVEIFDAWLSVDAAIVPFIREQRPDVCRENVSGNQIWRTGSVWLLALVCVCD
jgi:hypothetical protein